MNLINSIDSAGFFKKLNGEIPFAGSIRFINPSSTSRFIQSPANATAPNLGTGNFTIEFWVNLGTISYNGLPFMYHGQSATDAGNGYVITFSSSSGFLLRCRTNQLGNFTIPINTGNPATEILPCTWNHVAFVRNGTTMSGYINGVRTDERSVGTAYNLTPVAPSIYYIGRDSPFQSITSELNQQTFGSEITGIRLSNVARYSGATITVPSSKFISDANTLVLFNCESSGTYLQAVGGASGTTVMTMTGSTGVEFNSNYYPTYSPNNTLPITGSVNFGALDTQIFCPQWNGSFQPIPFTQTNNTIELWFLGSDTAIYSQGIFGMGPTSNNYVLTIGENNVAGYQRKVSWSRWAGTDQLGAIYVTSTTTLVNAVWYHIAVTRDSDNKIRLFINGKLEAISITLDPNTWNIANFWQLGRRQAGTAGKSVVANSKVTGFRAWDVCKYPTSAVVGTQVFTPSKTQANQFKNAFPSGNNGLLRSMDFTNTTDFQLCNGNIMPMQLSAGTVTWNSANPNV